MLANKMIANMPLADVQHKVAPQTLGELAGEIIQLISVIPSAEEIGQLLKCLGNADNEMIGVLKMQIGEIPITIGIPGTWMSINQKTYRFSPYVAGVLESDNMPVDPTVADRVASTLRTLNKAKAENGRGRIDSITLAALRETDEDVAEALKRLSIKQRITTKMKNKTGRYATLNLSWRNGVVMGSFSFDKNTAWNYGSFVLKNKELPASVISSLIGRRLNELVEHPFIDPSVDIRSVTGQNGGWLKINARIKTYVFNPETGEILGEEAAGA